MASEARTFPNSDRETPTEEALRTRLVREGFSPYRWSNGPNDRYAAHSHSYDKIIWVVSGSICFELVEEGQRLELEAGDRLELPSGTVHRAVVGAQGVVCLEAHR